MVLEKELRDLCSCLVTIRETPSLLKLIKDGLQNIWTCRSFSAKPLAEPETLTTRSAPKTQVLNSFTHVRAENSVPFSVPRYGSSFRATHRLPAHCCVLTMGSHTPPSAWLTELQLSTNSKEIIGFTWAKGKGKGETQRFLDAMNPAAFSTKYKNKYIQWYALTIQSLQKTFQQLNWAPDIIPLMLCSINHSWSWLSIHYTSSNMPCYRILTTITNKLGFCSSCWQIHHKYVGH